MALRWYTVVVDSLDPQAQARWWAQVLDWTLVVDTPEDAVIIPKDVPPGPLDDLASWMSAGQGMVFVRVPEEKSVKNRLHIDLAPHTSQDRDEEIARLLQMGAPRTRMSGRQRRTGGPSCGIRRGTNSACSPAVIPERGGDSRS